MLLKAGVVLLLFALFSHVRILNSAISWSLEPKLPPAVTSVTSSSLFVSGPAEIFPFWLPGRLCQEVVVSALQKSELLMPCCVICPTDGRFWI